MKRLLGCMVGGLIILGVMAPVSQPAVMADPDDFAGGDGSAGDPFQIANWYHLNNVRNHLDDHFILMNDLDEHTDGYADLAGPDADDGKGWQPIGRLGYEFIGAFDGRGYVIEDLVIDRVWELEVGLFGWVDAGGSVNAVGVPNAQVTGQGLVGGLAGCNYGTLGDCYATGGVNGSTAAGGLVGENFGTVTDCYATGGVNGSTVVGGLAGYNYGTLGDCYATGGVSGDSTIGGLVGDNDYGTVSNCFWDTDTSGKTASAGGTGKTTTEMQDISTYREQGTTGLTWPWDILSVAEGATVPYATWNIVDGEDYPFLTFGRVEVEVKAGWNLVSAPGGLGDGANTVEEVFGDQIEAIYYWNPDDPGSYDVPTVVEPNKGYWVAVTEDKTLILRI